MAASRFLIESVVRLRPPPGPVLLEGVEVGLHGPALVAAGGQRLLVLGGHALRCQRRLLPFS